MKPGEGLVNRRRPRPSGPAGAAAAAEACVEGAGGVACFADGAGGRPQATSGSESAASAHLIDILARAMAEA